MGDLESPQAYWRQTRRLTAALLAVWFLAAFVGPYFARSLQVRVFGWPFSYYLAAQGSLLIFLLIVYVYSRAQGARDAAFGVREGETE